MPKESAYADLDVLVSLLKKKDPKAFTYVYDTYSRALYGVIYTIVVDAEEAESVLQNTFILFWNSFENYEISKGRLYTWLLQIARKTATDYICSKYNNPKKRTFTHAILTENNIIIENNNLDTIGLNPIVNKMKEEHLLLIELFYSQGYSQEEVSKELNIPVGTVNSRLRKAMILLRECLKEAKKVH